MNVRYIESESRNQGGDIKPQWIILHCIGYKKEKALEILTGESGIPYVSAHYFVPELDLKAQAHLHNTPLEYPIYRLVPDTKKAYHGGVSQWRDIENFNEHAIGIEFSSPNYANALVSPENLNWYHFEPFTDDQIEAGIILIKDLIERFGIPPENVLMHSDISAWRVIEGESRAAKTDPGACFPMKRLAQNGIGVWPRFQRTREGALDMTLENVQQLLKDAGYHLEVTGKLDVPTQATIKAFKIHFMPEEYHEGRINDAISVKMIIGLENLIDREYQYALMAKPASNSHFFVDFCT